MDRTVAPGFTRIGPAVRSRLPGWPEDPPAGRTGREDRCGHRRHVRAGPGHGRGARPARRGGAARRTRRGEGCRGPSTARGGGARGSTSSSTAVTSPTSTTYAASPSELDVDRLDVLVHNAGAMPPTRTESPQGHELTMALHVLGPVLMTELLRPALTGHDARMIFVTSGGMYGQGLRADDPEYLRGDYSPTTAYARSKRAQVELLPVLARRWAAAGHRRARHPSGLGRHPRRGGVAAPVPPAHRSAAPRRRGRCRHHGLARRDRRPSRGRASSGTTAAAGRRTCCGAPAPVSASARAMWDWVREQTGLDA